MRIVGITLVLVLTSCQSTRPNQSLYRNAVLRLDSPNAAVARDAIRQVMSAGEESLPYLFELRGDQRTFTGGPVGDPQGAHFSFGGEIEGVVDAGNMLSVEAVALYLINAI